MSFYDNSILPWLCHFAMRNPKLVPYRERVAGAAHGRVLEIGIGSGLNLPLYGPQVDEVLGLEPALRRIEMSRSAARKAVVPVKLVEGSAEAIRIEDKGIDPVVASWTFCCVPGASPQVPVLRRE